MRGALAAMEDLLLPSSLLPAPTEKPRPRLGLGGSGTMRDSTEAVEVSASVTADASCFPWARQRWRRAANASGATLVRGEGGREALALTATITGT